MQDLFAGKTALVTGGAGFLGSHLCDHLLESGCRVIAVDNFVTGRKANLAHLADNSQFKFIEANVSQDPREYLESVSKLDFVFHFASPASPPRYQSHPVETYLVNSLGTHHLLQYLKAHQPEARFLFASTSEVYGDPLEHPQKESYWGNVNPNGLRSCYDESKRLGETICGVHHREFGLDVRIVRIFNTYGPRLDPGDGRVISNFISQAQNKEKLTIFGDGAQTRSYCFVEDLVSGILKFMTIDGLSGQTINLGNPEEHTVLQTAQIVFELVTGRKLDEADYEYKDLPSDDPTQRQPDISEANRLLNWFPQVSLKDGLERTLKNFK